MSEPIKVYATTWCPDCTRAKQVLTKNKVAFTVINIEDDPAAADIVVKINGGNRSVPTIVFPDGSVLVEPGNAELERKIASLK